MSRLEEKLIELGYYKHREFPLAYLKRHRDNALIIVLNKNKDSIDIEHCRTECMHYIFSKDDISNIKQAFNQLQKDLEALREYE